MQKEQIILEAVFQDKTGTAFKTIQTSMQNLQNGMTKTTSVVNGFNKTGEQTQNTITKLTPTIKRFKMEWLGVMFAGMALTRIFGGMIRQQMQLWGLSQGFSAMIQVVMIPIMEMLSDVLWPIIDFFMNLPEPIQKAIGIFILLATIFGIILFVGGQIALAVQSIGMVFSSVFGGLGAVVSGGLAALAPFLLIIGVIIILIVGIYLAWKENFMNIRNNIQNFIEGFKRWFQGIVDIVKGILKVIKGIFTGDFNLIKEGIMQIFKGLWEWLTGGFKAAFNMIVIIIKGAIKIILNVIEVVINSIIWLINAIGWVAGKVGKLFGGSGKSAWNIPEIPSFATGGVMPHTGLAYVHKGETITPANQTNNSPNIVINANVSRDYDVRRLADEIKKYLTTDYERVTKGRTI
jgi:phage-related protein